MCGIKVTVTSFYSDLAVPESSVNDGVLSHGEARKDGGGESPLESGSDGPDAWLARRGPDSYGSIEISWPAVREVERCRTCKLEATVLQMREALVPQPVRIRIPTSGNVSGSEKDTNVEYGYFAWNGELYEINEPLSATSESVADLPSSDPPYWSSALSDTQIAANRIQERLHKRILNATKGLGHFELIRDVLIEVLTSMVNAEFALCFVTDAGVFFGRDPFGRRSLLLFNPLEQQGPKKHHYTEWMISSVASLEPLKLENNQQSISNHDSPWSEVQPGVLHFFDSRTGSTSSYPYSPVLPATMISVEQTPNSSPWGDSCSHAHHLYRLLADAVRRRISCPLAEGDPLASPKAPPIGILFSGGLDSVVLAALTLEAVTNEQQVVLLNISFVPGDSNNVSSRKSNDGNPKAAVAADTRAALESYADLQRAFPHRRLKLLRIEGDWSNVLQFEERIRQLIFPQTTTMDWNIATALWFAAAGWCENETSENNVASENGVRLIDSDFISRQALSVGKPNDPSAGRLLLSGLGADELMGGYGRHRKAWDRGGWKAWRTELDLDVDRLWIRNMGRDDRVLSDTGKEVRFPFLDPHVIHYLRNVCPPEKIVDYTLPGGEGDKYILRQLAHHLQLPSACRAVKRAIQFGSRIAHVSDKARYGARRRACGADQWH
jgi:asparagine synthetase B (glutamine-hydrolysing)